MPIITDENGNVVEQIAQADPNNEPKAEETQPVSDKKQGRVREMPVRSDESTS